ncbi:uncharacterized protein LOC128548636 [Mercenaria mercenaria]|uniref:uncharacterized protein LOC128548636 n=1 Tax=Mercenaria mercenaria TaxID=6596 RepID=UPI00234F60AC|nr:uncharacterized protein LOC128548636 [Mercenaria mercenaria]
MCIINGRKDDGKCSFHSILRNNPVSSLVDYVITGYEGYQDITDFCVLEITEFSDHCPIVFELKNCIDIPQNDSVEYDKIFWDISKKDSFIEQVDNNSVLFDRINSRLLSGEYDIDQCMSEFSNLVHDISYRCFARTVNSRPKPKKKKSPWFDEQCRRAKSNFFAAKRQYMSNRSEENKVQFLNSKHVYSAVKRKAKSVFYNKEKIKLSDMSKTFPQNDSTSENVFNNMDFPDDIELNSVITMDEIENAAKMLKTGKACGVDDILNEHIKNTLPVMKHIYFKLFNIIFNNGIIPENWTIGVINPIYKNKGDATEPSNYRPITLLSCLGKLFTAVLNIRLQKFVTKYDLINEYQSGFRKGFSTIDNMFVLNMLIDLLKSSKKKLFCAFIDLRQAFDTVWRSGLWSKLIELNVNGKFLNVIKSIYNQAKSCVMKNGQKSDYFNCNIGVRQGENLSPLLFSMYLNDLHEYFVNNGLVEGVSCNKHNLDDTLIEYLKLFILLYADDTVIVSETRNDLQQALNLYEQYCEMWKLTLNTSKTKILIFSRGRRSQHNFHFKNDILEVVDEYKYLGVLFSRSGSFFKAKKHIAKQGTKAMYCLLKKAKALCLPIDMQIELFSKTVKPILLYGCEIWGYGNIDVIERVQLKFLKHILNLKSCTSNCMIYGETGVQPLSIDIKTRIVSFWAKLVQPTGMKLTNRDFDMLTMFMILFADDIVLFTTDPKSLQAQIDSVYQYSQKWGLKINVDKTKVCVFEKRKQNVYPDFVINGEKIEMVDNFIYLGVKFTYTGNMSGAVKALHDQALRAYHNLWSLFDKVNFDIKTKLSLFDKMVVPILMYGSEV